MVTSDVSATAPATTPGSGPAAQHPWAVAAARRLWARLEVIHTVGYFAPQVAQAHRDVGLRGWRMSYTAGRIAPMGPVGPQVAVATFYGFAPPVFARALPDAWGFASPGEVLDATAGAVGRVLDELWEPHGDTVAAAAELAREAAGLHPIIGRPLAAARAGLAWPHAPALVLWEAATRIRESRGDGHVACLVHAELDGVECHLTHVGDRPRLREQLTSVRGWSEPELDAAADRLRRRGLLTQDGALTPAGTALRAGIEQRTDELAAGPWVALGQEATDRLVQLLDTLVAPIVAAGVLPRIVTRNLDV